MSDLTEHFPDLVIAGGGLGVRGSLVCATSLGISTASLPFASLASVLYLLVLWTESTLRSSASEGFLTSILVTLLVDTVRSLSLIHI